MQLVEVSVSEQLRALQGKNLNVIAKMREIHFQQALQLKMHSTTQDLVHELHEKGEGWRLRAPLFVKMQINTNSNAINYYVGANPM